MAKLVEILARELEVWPDQAVAMAQDENAKVAGFIHEDLIYRSGNPGWCGRLDVLEAYIRFSRFKCELADDHPTAIVTRAEWQAAVDALKAKALVEWDGVGLPPVGTICEIKLSRKWTQVNIIAYYAGQPVIAWSCAEGDNVELRDACDLRPIRTPEQIAAEEREKVLSAMQADAQEGKHGPQISLQNILMNLYDAGYRKQEPK